MITRSNLRDLFVQHTVVTQRDATEPEPGTIDMVSGSDVVMFKKATDATVFIVDQGGDNILAVSRPRRVIVPLAFYTGTDAEALERTVQDRMLAVLAAGAFGFGGDHDPFPTAPAEQVIPYLRESLGNRGFSAVVTSTANAERLPGIPVPGYLFESVAEGIVYGVADPKFVGHIVEDKSRHPNDPLMDEEKMTPWPDGSFTHVGVIVHGGVVGVRIKR